MAGHWDAYSGLSSDSSSVEYAARQIESVSERERKNCECGDPDVI
jgi:hypothetical protein